MGASGSGKSVMLKMLIGLFESDGGEILFDGEDVTKMDEHQLYDGASSRRVPVPGGRALRLSDRGRERRLRPARAELEHDEGRGDPAPRRPVPRHRGPSRHRGHAPERPLRRHEEARRPRAHARAAARGHSLRRADDRPRPDQHGAHQSPHRRASNARWASRASSSRTTWAPPLRCRTASSCSAKGAC